jgi:hypothetical protein
MFFWETCIDCAELGWKWHNRLTGYQFARGLEKEVKGANFDDKSTSDREEKYKERFKGTVQRELRGVKIGINRTARINCIAGKCHLPCPKGHHHERSLNCSTF